MNWWRVFLSGERRGSRTVADESLYSLSLYNAPQWKYAAITGNVFGKCPSHYAAICALRRTAKKTMSVWVRETHRERERERATLMT